MLWMHQAPLGASNLLHCNNQALKLLDTHPVSRSPNDQNLWFISQGICSCYVGFTFPARRVKRWSPRYYLPPPRILSRAESLAKSANNYLTVFTSPCSLIGLHLFLTNFSVPLLNLRSRSHRTLSNVLVLDAMNSCMLFDTMTA